MSLYRQPGRTAPARSLIAAAVALSSGSSRGFALGRSTAPEPTLADKVADLRATLAPPREGVELCATEYPQAVRDGQVVAPTEYAAAQGRRPAGARRRRGTRGRPAGGRPVAGGVAGQGPGRARIGDRGEGRPQPGQAALERRGQRAERGARPRDLRRRLSAA